MTSPPLTGLSQWLHVGLVQVTHDPIHQPSHLIDIHPIFHCYWGHKSEQASASIFQIKGCLSFKHNEIHVFLVLYYNYMNMINLYQPLAKKFLPRVLSLLMFISLLLGLTLLQSIIEIWIVYLEYDGFS